MKKIKLFPAPLSRSDPCVRGDGEGLCGVPEDDEIR